MASECSPKSDRVVPARTARVEKPRSRRVADLGGGLVVIVQV